jgi:hypothetical protein
VRPYQLVFDGALPSAVDLRQHALGLDYRGEIGPDGVEYPNISGDVSLAARGDLEYALTRALGEAIDVKLCFFRLSLADTVAPHWAHTDTIISDYLALLYLTRDEDCRGGTAIVEHVSGMKKHPRTKTELATWREDTNRPERWVPKTIAPMKFNRLVILPTDVFHAATPQGFGSSVEDGRLVLITFFSRKGN